ncbi:TrmH family RNA methyltransferase [Hanstruepera ponticola]|uniref:TrmH family RNA methyltransferase n=1 Tax=Hanstruepera ponticola TaxID=2042995 RepID=UPI001784FE5B|nr:RNA methyltransferase [Hanstruepera ponticola]
MKNTETKEKSSLRKKADSIKEFRCKNLIAVLEEPQDYKNIGRTIRNINALGVEKLYIVDSRNKVPNDWQEMRTDVTLTKTSGSAIKWSFVKKFSSTKECIDHLEKNGFKSMVTSPHLKGRKNIVLHEGKYTKMKLAVWFGNESKGVSNEAIENSKACINIPMYGIIESLNLGTSTGIVMYEITKQRRAFKLRKVAKRKEKLKNKK